MLAEERRRRLLKAMGEAGIQTMIVYGNAWQIEHLRYVSGFGILEGNGIAMITTDGSVRLFLDSAVEAERAEVETHGVEVNLVGDIARAVGMRLDRIANHRIAATPRRFVPKWLADVARGFALEDGTGLMDRLLIHKLPPEIAAFRRAAKLADEGYAVFKAAIVPGRRQYEVIAEVEAFFRAKGSPDNFMLIGSGGIDVTGMSPPSDRRIAVGDLVITELTPAVDGYFAQICRTLVVGKANEAQRRAFNVYLEATEAGIAKVRSGTTCANVAKAENDVFRKYGLGEYVTDKYTRVRGHGLGLSADAKPQILENVDTVLEPGMTIIVHPNTYHPEVGYVVLGDSIIVTENGAEVVCRTPRELFELPT